MLRKVARAGPADFLSGGEMGERIRAFDWSRHPLGRPAGWPPSLKTAVSLILNSQHPMWVGWGPDISFLYNDACLHVLGEAKHEWALGHPAAEVWAEIWDVVGPLAEKALREGEATCIDDMRLFMDRGDFLEETYYSYSCSPIRDESGQVCGLFCPSNDVSPKVIGARRLRTLSELASHALVERTVEAACASAAVTLSRNPDDVPFALIYLAEDGRAVLKGAVQLEHAGTLLAPPEVRLADDSAGVIWPLAEVFASGKTRNVPVSAFSALPNGPAGRPPTQALALPMISRLDGSTLGVLIVGVSPARRLDADYSTFFDLLATHVATAIQNARAAEEEKRRLDTMAKLDRAKTTFFSDVSHEFRTPLTLMLGPIEALLKATDLAPEQRDQLEAAHRNSLRLLKLVDSLLDFSRIEAGRVSAAYEPTDLAAFTAELASTFRSAIEAAGVEFMVDCPALGEPVYVDREMWEKIVLNLLSNAFKFTLTGRITLRLATAKDHVTLAVTDTGTGIPAQELPHIFERFHRIEGAHGRSMEGTGIGLALVQELVRMHGGSVSAESRPGQGSTFTVAIPRGNAHLPAEHLFAASAEAIPSDRRAAFTEEALSWMHETLPARPDPGARGAGRPRILFADDNADMHAHICSILGQDYEVEAVADGKTAFEVAHERVPDLVLTDIMVPRPDGFALLAALRADPATANIPVVLLSARAGAEARSEGMDAGADDYLVKPFSARELRARVGAHVRLARARHQAEAALRHSEARYRALAEQVADGIFVAASDGRYLDANRAAAEMMGYSLEELLTLKVSDVLVPDELPKLPRQFERLASGEIVRNDWRFRRKDGSTFIGELVGRQLPDGRLQGVVRDVTERLKAEEALRFTNAALVRANEDLSQFAFAASHDLQEPLRMITSYSQLLLQGYRGQLSGEAAKCVEYITEGTKRMRGLLSDLLAYTRLSGELRETPALVDLNAAFRTALENCRAAAQETRAVVTSDPLPAVPGHQPQFVQLFQNLISNSLKYHGAEAPRVHVSAQRRADSWRIAVRDNGIGIAPEYHRQIFGVFKRLHGASIPGTGIGLAICQRVVARCGGRIWVDSQPGRGATFYFTLPAAGEAAREEGAAAHGS